MRVKRKAPHRPYSVLLPVGFAVPPTLPPARCALTAPFHPCCGKTRHAPQRSVLCGTFPGLAPAGCYPAPLVHGARTFLPGNLSVSPERPSGRLTRTGMGARHVAVKGGADTAWVSPSHTLKATKTGGDLILDAAEKNIKANKDLVLTIGAPAARLDTEMVRL